MSQLNVNTLDPTNLEGEKRMNIVTIPPENTGLIYTFTKPVSLWLTYNTRKIQNKPTLQEEILDRLVTEQKKDDNLLSILLFGSVASGTQSWKSDIDLIFIYETYDPPSGLVNRWIDGIEVQYFYATLEELVENAKTVPYLLHMFHNAKILFDRHGTVAPIIGRLKEYFTAHPDIAREWTELKELHQVEKKGPACQQTTIIQRWDEMEQKYSDGRPKRTFFTL